LLSNPLPDIIRPDLERILQKTKILIMKTDNSCITAPINGKETKELFNEAKGTISRNNATNPTFTALDLWRMQKKHKSLGSSIRW